MKKIKLLRKTSSDHMKMCDQIMSNFTQKQDSFQSLYDLIMKNWKNYDFNKCVYIKICFDIMAFQMKIELN